MHPDMTRPQTSGRAVDDSVLRLFRSPNRFRLGDLLATGLVTVMLTSCAAPTPHPPPPVSASAAQGDFAGLVDIGGGRKLFLECHGSGSPTVIFQSGYGNAADIWNEADADPPAGGP